jgi:hypothetical protein
VLWVIKGLLLATHDVNDVDAVMAQIDKVIWPSEHGNG